MTKPTGRPKGRPKGSLSAEPTLPIPCRAPLWLLGAFRERWGEKWAERLRTLMERDVKRNP